MLAISIDARKFLDYVQPVRKIHEEIEKILSDYHMFNITDKSLISVKLNWYSTEKMFPMLELKETKFDYGSVVYLNNVLTQTCCSLAHVIIHSSLAKEPITVNVPIDIIEYIDFLKSNI